MSSSAQCVTGWGQNVRQAVFLTRGSPEKICFQAHLGCCGRICFPFVVGLRTFNFFFSPGGYPWLPQAAHSPPNMAPSTGYVQYGSLFKSRM